MQSLSHYKRAGQQIKGISVYRPRGNVSACRMKSCTRRGAYHMNVFGTAVLQDCARLQFPLTWRRCASTHGREAMMIESHLDDFTQSSLLCNKPAASRISELHVVPSRISSTISTSKGRAHHPFSSYLGMALQSNALQGPFPKSSCHGGTSFRA
jgi:hypothetical protein